MAGIGFVLRKLMRDNTLSSYLKAYLHATLASSGQWIFTVIALASFFLLSENVIATERFIEFRTIILYNFAFSLVLSAPIIQVGTRFLADAIYFKKFEEGCSLLIGITAFLVALALPLSIYFYFFYCNMSPFWQL